MRFDLLHPADQLVMIMQRIYEYGMTTTSGGNLSIMDSDGVMWITPAGVDKGSIIASIRATHRKIVCLFMLFPPIPRAAPQWGGAWMRGLRDKIRRTCR